MTCKTCGGTGTINAFVPGPTCRGEHGDMENWPSPCPDCAYDGQKFIDKLKSEQQAFYDATKLKDRP